MRPNRYIESAQSAMKGLSVKQRSRGKSNTVQQLLARLGISKRKLYRSKHENNANIRLGSVLFWNRTEANLLELLETARSRWRQLMKKHHPDKIGGSLRQAADLNLTWERVRKLFKRRGLDLP